jgi:alpha-tubulin suppressor-like RCC1 family protein
MSTPTIPGRGRFSLFFRRRWRWGALALLGGLLGWGVWLRLFPGGSLDLPAGSVTPKVSMAWQHGVVLAPDGSLWSWGGEDMGWPVLGRGDTNQANFDPQSGRVGSYRDWVDVSAGQDHVLALKADGSMWGWGANYQGQLGNGKVGRMEHRPVRAAPGTNWVQAEAGSVCSFGLRRDGSLWAWGLNNFCQLGIGSWLDTSNPTQVGTATNWVLVRQGGVSSAGIQADGSLWIWGGSPAAGNSKPQSSTNLLVPTLFAAGTSWSDVTMTYNLWAGVQADGSLWVWGRDATRYVGSAASDPTIPVRIGTDADWRNVSVSQNNLLLRKKDGSWWFLDRGSGTAASSPQPLTAMPSSALSGDATAGCVVVLGADRQLRAWGSELGNRPTHVKLAALVERLCALVGLKVDLTTMHYRLIRREGWTIRNRNE